MKISEFLSENFQFLEVKFSIYLNRCVFVMYFLLMKCQQKQNMRSFSHNFASCLFITRRRKWDFVLSRSILVYVSLIKQSMQQNPQCVYDSHKTSMGLHLTEIVLV